MQRPFTNSFLLKGIIEEVDVNKMSKTNFDFRHLSSERIDKLALSIQQHDLLLQEL